MRQFGLQKRLNSIKMVKNHVTANIMLYLLSGKVGVFVGICIYLSIYLNCLIHVTSCRACAMRLVNFLIS